MRHKIIALFLCLLMFGISFGCSDDEAPKDEGVNLGDKVNTEGVLKADTVVITEDGRVFLKASTQSTTKPVTK